MENWIDRICVNKCSQRHTANSSDADGSLYLFLLFQSDVWFMSTTEIAQYIGSDSEINRTNIAHIHLSLPCTGYGGGDKEVEQNTASYNNINKQNINPNLNLSYIPRV